MKRLIVLVCVLLMSCGAKNKTVTHNPQPLFVSEQLAVLNLKSFWNDSKEFCTPYFKGTILMVECGILQTAPSDILPSYQKEFLKHAGRLPPYIVVGAQINVLISYDLQTKRKTIKKVSYKPLSNCSFGGILRVCANEYNIIIGNIFTGEVASIKSKEGKIISTGVDPEGNYIAYTTIGKGENYIVGINTNTGRKTITTLPLNERGWFIFVSPQGRVYTVTKQMGVFSTTWKLRVQDIDAVKDKLIRNNLSGLPEFIVVDPSESRLALIKSSGEVEFISLVGGKSEVFKIDPLIGKLVAVTMPSANELWAAVMDTRSRSIKVIKLQIP